MHLHIPNSKPSKKTWHISSYSRSIKHEMLKKRVTCIRSCHTVCLSLICDLYSVGSALCFFLFLWPAGFGPSYQYLIKISEKRANVKLYFQKIKRWHQTRLKLDNLFIWSLNNTKTSTKSESLAMSGFFANPPTHINFM